MSSSPPPAHNFVRLPAITSARPLYDEQHDVVEAGPPPPVLPWRAPIVGILAFIFSEATFFGALIVAFIDFRLKTPQLPELDVPRTLLFSVSLFASSGTVYLAERRLGHGDQAGFRRWWIASIVLGVVFLLGQLTE